MESVNKVEAGGAQGGNFVNSTVNNPTFNIGQSDTQINISRILAQYKRWVLAKKQNSQLSTKLQQLVINGALIKRTLSRKGETFSAGDLLDKIPQSETSLVTGPAGSGKSTLAASTTVAWAKSSESRFDLVLYLSSLHQMNNLPLHKQVWGEFAGHIRDQDSLMIYQKLLDMKDKILFIIDGIGKNCILIKDDDHFVSRRVTTFYRAD